MFKLIIVLTTIVCLIQGDEVEEKQEGWTQDYSFSYPFAVSIQYKNEAAANKHLCTGSIIKRQHIVTAASCFDSMKPDTEYIIRAASRFMYEEGDVVEVDKVIIHPEYKVGEKEADIALIILKTPIKFNRKAQQILLPAKDYVPTGECQLAGWGGLLKKTQEAPSEKLLGAFVNVLPIEESKKFYENLLESQIIVGGLKSVDAPCKGTAGIPLMQVIKRPVLVGVAQVWPENCEGPALFTNVAKYLEFIQEHSK